MYFFYNLCLGFKKKKDGELGARILKKKIKRPLKWTLQQCPKKTFHLWPFCPKITRGGGSCQGYTWLMIRVDTLFYFHIMHCDWLKQLAT